MAAVEPMLHTHYVRSRELGDEITELCAYLYASTYELLVKIREFDQEELWHLEGICSCAHWLNWKCGIGMNAAREKVRVANALAELPKISEAFSKGEVSYSKVRAMTRAATPENEDYLLMIARHGTASHMESLISGYRKVRRLREVDTANEQYRDRELYYRYDEDGALLINGRFTPETGAMILKALQMAVDNSDPDISAETRNPFGVRRADALAEIAESYLATGAASSSSAERYQVMVHVSAETLKSESKMSAETAEEADDISEIENGPHVSAETSRRICCDASISVLIEGDNRQPLSISRKSRVIPPAMRRALRSRDKGCRFPGCTHQHFIDGHHIKHWSDGGKTSLENLVQLCRYHHRLVHEGGFACEKGKHGQIIFRDQQGQIIGNVIELPRIASSRAVARMQERLEDLYIDSQTCVTRWQGEQMDRSQAVENLWYIDFPIDNQAASASAGS